ncbi:hypothetical protein RUM44_005865 [Polyplax serrata]|uniref:Uncharacterized protein n=1 Tax=Polyplax serrata TaxID=468196 RepID=A0ABR1AYA5_POLSC
MYFLEIFFFRGPPRERYGNEKIRWALKGGLARRKGTEDDEKDRFSLFKPLNFPAHALQVKSSNLLQYTEIYSDV